MVLYYLLDGTKLIVKFEKLFVGGMPESIRTRVVKATGYANLVRRAAFAVFKGKVDPKIVARDVAFLNKTIFEELIKRGIDKDDYIRISVVGEYDDKEKAIKWRDLNIERFIPDTQLKDLTEKIKELEDQVKKLKKENESLKKRVAGEDIAKLKEENENLRKEIEAYKARISLMEDELNKYKTENSELKKRLDELSKKAEDSRREVARLKGILRAIADLVSKAIGE